MICIVSPTLVGAAGLNYLRPLLRFCRWQGARLGVGYEPRTLNG
jgi:hypothetical protein